MVNHRKAKAERQRLRQSSSEETCAGLSGDERCKHTREGQSDFYTGQLLIGQCPSLPHDMCLTVCRMILLALLLWMAVKLKLNGRYTSLLLPAREFNMENRVHKNHAFLVEPTIHTNMQTLRLDHVTDMRHGRGVYILHILQLLLVNGACCQDSTAYTNRNNQHGAV